MTEAQVAEACQLFADGLSGRSVARHFGAHWHDFRIAIRGTSADAAKVIHRIKSVRRSDLKVLLAGFMIALDDNPKAFSASDIAAAKRVYDDLSSDTDQ